MSIRSMACLIALLALPLAAQEPPKKADADAAMQRYMDLAQPGPEHKRLQAMTGEWDVASRWQVSPRTKSVPLTGTASTRAILGGRFFESIAHSSGPLGVESLTIFGFDRRTNDYTFVSFDTLGTYYVTAAGKWDEQQQTIVMRGEENDPELKMKQSYTVRIKPMEADQFVLTIAFDIPGGKEYTAVESTYRRRKS